jgi:hypothetical protein
VIQVRSGRASERTACRQKPDSFHVHAGRVPAANTGQQETGWANRRSNIRRQQPGIPIGPGASGRTQQPAAAHNTTTTRTNPANFDTISTDSFQFNACAVSSVPGQYGSAIVVAVRHIACAAARLQGVRVYCGENSNTSCIFGLRLRSGQSPHCWWVKAIVLQAFRK